MVAHMDEPLITDPRRTLNPCKVHTRPAQLRITPGTRKGQIRFTGQHYLSCRRRWLLLGKPFF